MECTRRKDRYENITLYWVEESFTGKIASEQVDEVEDEVRFNAAHADVHLSTPMLDGFEPGALVDGAGGASGEVTGGATEDLALLEDSVHACASCFCELMS